MSHDGKAAVKKGVSDSFCFGGWDRVSAAQYAVTDAPRHVGTTECADKAADQAIGRSELKADEGTDERKDEKTPWSDLSRELQPTSAPSQCLRHARLVKVTNADLMTSSDERLRIVRRSIPELAPDVVLHENAIAARVLAARGITSAEEIDYHVAHLPKPDALPSIDAAIHRLFAARESRERVMIVGDYDCDGATSTAVAVLGLQMLGFDPTRVHHLVPNRFANGYGLSPAIVDRVLETLPTNEGEALPLIVTVDNGVAAVDAVAQAASLGVDVLVTDHHLPPEQLPRACAIVNPALERSQFPTRALAGVGVIFYVLLALRAKLREGDDAHAKAPLADLLDLVAIGTVADLVPLDRVNRTLVEQGLRRIRAGRSRPGVYALLKTAGRDAKRISADDIGFAIGPRLNAAGRIDDMRHGIACLLADNVDDARRHAKTLDTHNRKRRALEAHMRGEADLRLAVSDADENAEARDRSSTRFTFTLFDPGWHEGVIGILASRLKERWHRPVVVLTSDDSGNLKGSSRSIPGVHIRDVLSALDTRHPGLLLAYGGHAMAAGMTLREDSVSEFDAAFEAEVKRVLGDRLPTREWLSDGALDPADFSLDQARLINALGPWGQGFEAPQFDGEFTVISHRTVGTGHLKLVLQPNGGSDGIEAIAFNTEDLYHDGQQVRLVYRLDINVWRERETLQLLVQQLGAV